jgi:hypothetical protein
MTKEEKSLLLALAIGDGYINPTNNVLYLKHSIHQEDYLKWKFELINKIVPNHGKVKNNIYYGENYDKRTGKSYKFCSCHKGHPYIRVLRKWLYKPNKTLTRAVLNRLSAKGLAIWFMDDGNLKGRYSAVTGKLTSIQVVLSTHCSEEEISILHKYFLEVWGVNFSRYLIKNSGKYILCGNTKEGNKFLDIIRPYVIPSMSYKVNLPSTSARPLNEGEDIV